MLISKSELVNNKNLKLSSNTEITDEDLKHVEGFISLESCQVDVSCRYIEGMDLAVVNLKVEGKLNIESTRSLKPVLFSFKDEDEITYSFSKSEELEDDTIIEVEGNEIELHDAIISLIITSLPIKIVSKDEPESFSGNNWEVISEDEYNKRSQEATNNPFACLDDLDLD